nr:apolipoprotein A1/A4/E family protein [Kribbella shirazensis]
MRKSNDRVEAAKDRVRPIAESASEKLGPAVGQVREHLAPAVGTAREKVSPYAEKAVERGAHLAHQAVEKAGPVLDDALAKVGPATEHAAGKARERLNDDVLPKVTAALATLAAAAEPVVEETTRRGKATKAALKGELEVPKKSHKLRNLVLFLGLGALAAAAVKKLLTPPEPAWQSTPTSGRDYSSAPTGTTTRPTDTTSSASPSTSTASNGQTDTKPESDASKPDTKADAPTADAPKAGATPDDVNDEVKAASNGAAKKTTTRKPTGSSESKPTDS